MNAVHELEQLLRDSGAVFERRGSKGHAVYRLPNGRIFTHSSSPSDVNAIHQARRELRKALAEPPIGNERRQTIIVTELQRDYLAPASAMMPPPQAADGVDGHAAAAPPAAAIAGVPSGALASRINAAIAESQVAYERLLAEAERAEKRVQLLKFLLTYADDPGTENVLAALVPPPPPPAELPKMQAISVPPIIHASCDSERVKVTRPLVFAAIQALDTDEFTINDVCAMMIGPRKVDPREQQRIRQSVTGAMQTLTEHGEISKLTGGRGRGQSVYSRKAQRPGSR